MAVGIMVANNLVNKRRCRRAGVWFCSLECPKQHRLPSGGQPQHATFGAFSQAAQCNVLPELVVAGSNLRQDIFPTFLKRSCCPSSGTPQHAQGLQGRVLWAAQCLEVIGSKHSDSATHARSCVGMVCRREGRLLHRCWRPRLLLGCCDPCGRSAVT